MWIIKSKCSLEELYWSNEIGWVSIHDVTLFNSKSGYNLPIGGEWVSFQKEVIRLMKEILEHSKDEKCLNGYYICIIHEHDMDIIDTCLRKLEENNG